MNALKYLLVTFLFIEKSISQMENSDYDCDRYLMESYDLDGDIKQVVDKNIVCPGVAANCCSYNAQLQIYKKFVVANEGDRIKNFYGEFSKVYEKIFESFTEIEELAKSVKERTVNIVGSNCAKFADKIEFLKVSRMYPKFKVHVSKAYDFLLKSRQGFYCSLCDAKAHQYFNLTSSEITGSWGFCGKMVSETLNYFYFKYNFFIKFSRLYSEFLVKCDLRGNYRPKRSLKFEIKFYRKDKFVGALEKCERGYDKPVKYDIYLEGEIDKLTSFEKSIKKLIEKMKRKYEKDLKDEEEFYKNERQLSETKEVKQTVRLDEEVNQINLFNKEFKTAFVRPISYDFSEDLSIKYHINFSEPLFAGGVERLYNLVVFKTLIEKDGLNFYNYGEMAVIDKESAMKVFENLNPENAQNEKEFEKMLAG